MLICIPSLQSRSFSSNSRWVKGVLVWGDLAAAAQAVSMLVSAEVDKRYKKEITNKSSDASVISAGTLIKQCHHTCAHT